VYLQNAAGEGAQCGPLYSHLGFFLERGQETNEQLLRQCVAGYSATDRGFVVLAKLTVVCNVAAFPVFAASVMI
jgi:hypothetical protein